MSYRSEAVGFNGNLYLPLAGGTMTGSILVGADNTIDLASATTRWRAIYAYTVDLKSGINAVADATTSMTARAADSGLSGFSWSETAGAGAAAGATNPGGNGGSWSIFGGNGGAGTGVRAGGGGGDITIDAGNAGADGGAGTGTPGSVNIATTRASSLTLGRNGITSYIQGTLRYDSTAVSGSAGAGAALPSNVEGWLSLNIGGTTRVVPFFVTP